MMIPNKFNGYSRDGVRLYFDPATIASLAAMMETSSAVAIPAAEAAAAASAAATAATAAPTMLDVVSGAMKTNTFPGASTAAETAAEVVPQITAGVPPVPVEPPPDMSGIMQGGTPPNAESQALMTPAGNPPPPMGPPQLQMGPPSPPPGGMSQGIFSNPTLPSGSPSLLPGQVPPGVAPAEGGYNALNFGQTNGIPQGGTLEAGATGGSLGSGFETAMKFMMKNATPLSVGMQAISALGGQQGPKRSTFKPGYRLSPNFKPTLAPSAPSGVYGRGFADGGIIGQMPQQDAVGINSGYPMTQHTFPAYSGIPDGTGANVEGYSDTPQYAKGGVTRFMGGGYNGMQGQYGPTEEETAAAAKAAVPEYDINALYQKYLGRDADESGRKTYDPKKFTQQQLSGILQGSEEYKGQTLDPAEIQAAYKNVLKRDVDPTGAEGYLGQNYSPGAFEDFLKQSKEYKEDVPFRTMERTVYRPEYEDYAAGSTPEAETTAKQYLAMAKKGEKGMATGGKAKATPEEEEAALQAKYAKMQGIKSSEESQADVDELVAYQKHMNNLGVNTDEDVDTRLLDPYSAAQVRLAKVGKKYKVPVAEMPKTSTNLANMAHGGITQNLGSYSDGGHLLKGPGDGMSDHIPAMIGKHQPARLADGEFVIPADVVSHLGNGSTEAGAKQLYAMMSRIRKARTGNPKQGKQVNPRKLMPK